MEKLEGTAEIGHGFGGHAQMYRLTTVDGEPLMAGLSTSVAAAEGLAKSRGWRPTTADLVTAPKAKSIPKKSSNTYHEGLGFGD